MFDFAPLTGADLPLLHRWLQEPHVRAHYDDGLRTLEQVAAYYADCLRGREPTRLYICSLDGTPIAFLQTYRIADYPDYAAIVEVGDDAAGVDMLIGEPAYVHRGLGGPLLAAFVERIVWPVIGARACWIGPSVDNPRAIRAYEKAGFVHVKTVCVAPEREYLMRLLRGV